LAGTTPHAVTSSGPGRNVNPRVQPAVGRSHAGRTPTDTQRQELVLARFIHPVEPAVKEDVAQVLERLARVVDVIATEVFKRLFA
jgi:hypothetical protein